MKTDGGPAFPGDVYDDAPAPGMSLRDWYVGQALSGICANAITDGWDAAMIARYTIELADATLEAREKPDE